MAKKQELDYPLLVKALSLAKNAAKKSGDILLQKYKQIDRIENKGLDIQDFVTEADVASEQLILKLIKKSYPQHTIIAEESGTLKQHSPYSWAIDPLCGTANFVNQIDLFAISIGLLFKNEPVLGVIYLPLKRELYWAIKGKSAFREGRAISVSKTRLLKSSFICFTLGKGIRQRQRWVKPIAKLVTGVYKLREFGSTPVSCALIGEGKAEGYIALPEAWDVAASAVIIEAAGGKVTDWDGKPWTTDSDSLIISNGLIHKQIIRLLKS